MRRALILAAAVAPVLWMVVGFAPALAQGTPPGGAPPNTAPPPGEEGIGDLLRAANAPPDTRSGREAAPIDLTGYWVPLITEDWRLRMFTPAKGEYFGVPLTRQGMKVTGSWNPEADEAAGLQCKSYGAPNIMRKPGRLHITWQDSNTLKLEFDAGMQTRLFSFGSTVAGKPDDWQGVSKASWDFIPAPITTWMRMNLLSAHMKDNRAGSLNVVTTNLKPGYIRTNGVPYSAEAVLTEYFDVVQGPNKETYLLVSELLKDPVYLTREFLLTTQWRKQKDATGWNPVPCAAR